MTAEILHRQSLPTEMSSPPYGATISVFDDHTTLEVPYAAGTMGTITILHGEVVKLGLVFDEEAGGRLTLQITREKLADAQAG